MDLGILATLPLTTLALCLLIAFVSGVVKGAIGFAMPLIIVSGVSSLVDPKLALAAIIFPIVLANGLQTFRKGIAPALEALQEYWRYVVVVCFAIFITAQFVTLIPSQVFYFVLGVPVVGLSLIQLLGVSLTIPPAHRRRAEWIIGVISGILGGIAGTWGPLTVLFLLATNTPKAKQIIVQGVVYGAGSVTLLAAHLQSGILNRDTAPLSLALIPAAMIGLWVGFQAQDRLDQHLFRKVTLVVLVVVGLNLLRKGWAG